MTPADGQSDATEPSGTPRGRWARFGSAAMTPVRSFRATARTSLLQALKTAIAAVIAWVVCAFIAPEQIPVFGAIAAIIVVQPSVNQSLSRALERSIGVIVGVVVAFLASTIFGSPSWLILAAIVASVLLGWALRFPQSSTVQVPISAMLVLTIGAQTPGYAVERIIETIIGALIGVVINWLIVPPVALQPAHDALSALGREVAATLDGLAIMLSAPTDEAFRSQVLVEARLLRPMLVKAQSAIDTAEESLRFNPRRSNHREVLAADTELATMLSRVLARVLGMARTLSDHFDDSLHSEPTARAIGEELRRAAHDLRLVMERVDAPAGGASAGGRGGSGAGGSSSGASGAAGGSRAGGGAGSEGAVDRGQDRGRDGPALTAPLQAVAPDSTHWILIGSMLEDLRRVREEIVGAGEERH